MALKLYDKIKHSIGYCGGCLRVSRLSKRSHSQWNDHLACESESTSSFTYGFVRGASGTWNTCISSAKQLVPKLMNRLTSSRAPGFRTKHVNEFAAASRTKTKRTCKGRGTVPTIVQEDSYERA